MTTLNKYYRNIKIDYIFTVLSNMDLTSGIWLIYLASKGMNLVWLGILEGILHLTSLIMETPTGAIADLFGRKFSRQIGVLISILYSLLLLFGTEKWHFILAFMFCALSYNLESGAGEALVYDSLKSNGKEEAYARVSGIKEVFFQGASGIGLVLGGYLAVTNYNLPFITMIGITVIAFVVSCFFYEVPIPCIKEKMPILKAMKNQYKVSFNFVRTEKKVLFLAIVLNVIATFVIISFYYMQNYWKGMGVSESTIGIMLALHSLFAALGGFTAHKIEKRLGEKKIILSSVIVLAIMYWFLYIPSATFLVVIAIGFIDSLIYVVLNTYINHLIPSEQRATLLSFSSMLFSMMMIILFPLVGLMGDQFGLPNTFLALAVVLTTIAIPIIYKVVISDRQISPQ